MSELKYLKDSRKEQEKPFGIKFYDSSQLAPS
jgi:hypothetical protein